jgi:hypothetical protein
MRGTIEVLRRAVDYLNKISRGRYRLEGAYGGWKLSMEIEGSGMVDVTPGFVPKSQLLYTINAIIRYLELEERVKKEEEKAKKEG